jgi:hypothetical protein
MYSPLAAALDVPQTRPPVPPSFDQTAEWYERQGATGLPSNTVFAPDECRFAGSIFSPACSYEQARPNRDSAAQLRSLQQHYTILDSNRVIIKLLEEESALYTLLVEAVSPLKNAFGEGRIVQVRVQFSDDDSLLKVAVQLPADFENDPERALRSFDEDWWLSNCHRSGGALVFDYEIQDAV